MIITSTNCQTIPAVRQMISDRVSGLGPLRESASQGATTQASRPMGTMADAQTPRILRSEY